MPKARADEPTTEAAATNGPTPTACRHCGKSSLVDVQETPDWFCTKCGRYVEQMACPTCHQPTIIANVPPELVPAPVAPVED